MSAFQNNFLISDFDRHARKDKVLDLANPAVAKEFGYAPGLVGYNVIKFGSTKAVVKDWEKILRPNLPVK